MGGAGFIQIKSSEEEGRFQRSAWLAFTLFFYFYVYFLFIIEEDDFSVVNGWF
jgi:hypothetical protein